MKNTCLLLISPDDRADCQKWAQRYADAVRAWGDDAYTKGQAQGCCGEKID